MCRAAHFGEHSAGRSSSPLFKHISVDSPCGGRHGVCVCARARDFFVPACACMCGACACLVRASMVRVRSTSVIVME